MADWLSILSEYPQHAIEYGCDMHIRNQPRKRPTPGDILRGAQAKLKRDAEYAPRRELPPPPKDVISPERAAEIMAEYGFDGNLAQIVKAFPMETDRATAAKKFGTPPPLGEFEYTQPGARPETVALVKRQRAGKEPPSCG